MDHKNPLKGKYIALIPDGNRRWAKENGKKPWEGHKKGAETLDKFIDWAIIKNKVKSLSVYSLSTQNLKERPAEEVKNLVELYIKKFQSLAEDERVKDSIKIKFSGNLPSLPPKLKKVLDSVQKKTKDNSEHTINFLLPYGGRYEMTRTMRNIAEKVKDKAIDVKDITRDKIRENLLVREDQDLVIRTAEKRMSNFLIWQTAYSEIFFVDKNWPDFTEKDFNKIKKSF